MRQWAKTALAIVLLPFCAGLTIAVLRVLRHSAPADTVWVALASGAACWIISYLLLPRPVWLYVFGHELTHVVWAWLFGGRVKSFHAGSRGGRVVVTRNNFLISLAPYFFPIYVFFVAGVFLAGDWLWGWSPYRAWFHFLIGFTYAFHVTLTFHALGMRQSDLVQHGYLFSAVCIWVGNMLVLLFGFSLLASRVSLVTALGWALQSTGNLLVRLAGWI